MNTEHVINVPLKPEVKRLLEEQADSNGRAMGREAAILIKKGLRKPRRTAAEI